MMAVFLKAKIQNTEKVKEILLFLGGKYVRTEELTYAYAQVDKNTVKFLRSDDRGRTYLFTCKTLSDNHNVVVSVPVEDSIKEKEALESHFGTLVYFTKQKALYLLKDIEVAFSTISDLGLYLELESEQHSYEELMEYIKKFGIGKKEIVLSPYNQLVLEKKEKLSVKR